MPLIRISIPNWEKFNPRADRANYTWFRFQNGYFSDQAIFPLTDSQIVLHGFCLCELSKKNAASVELLSEYIAAVRRRDEKEILNDLQVLHERGVIEISTGGDEPANRRRDDGEPPALLPATNERTNVTNERNDTGSHRGSAAPIDFDFESLYKKYPRQEGRSRGLEACHAQIKTQADFDSLSKAIDHYAKACANKSTEGKFVKQFSTFMGCWRDYISPTAGSTTLPRVSSLLMPTSGPVRVFDCEKCSDHGFVIEADRIERCDCVKGRSLSSAQIDKQQTLFERGKTILGSGFQFLGKAGAS